MILEFILTELISIDFSLFVLQKGSQLLKARYGGGKGGGGASRMGSTVSMMRSRAVLVPESGTRLGVPGLQREKTKAIELRPMKKKDDKASLIPKDNQVAPVPDIQVEVCISLCA